MIADVSGKKCYLHRETGRFVFNKKAIFKSPPKSVADSASRASTSRPTTMVAMPQPSPLVRPSQGRCDRNVTLHLPKAIVVQPDGLKRQQ